MGVITNYLSSVGEKTSQGAQWGLNLLSEMGLFTSSITAKILTILILFVVAYLVLSVITIAKKPIKFGIIALIVLLVLSIILSF